jgi:hypothetical protein
VRRESVPRRDQSGGVIQNPSRASRTISSMSDALEATALVGVLARDATGFRAGHATPSLSTGSDHPASRLSRGIVLSSKMPLASKSA